MPSVLRHRDFRLLWAGLTVSELGNSVTYVALPLVAVLALHASAFQIGLISAASSVAWLVIGLPAGVWVDRLRRRPVMIASDLVRAVLMVSIPVGWWLGVLTVAQLVAVALLLGVGTVFFTLANTAFTPRVLPADRLPDGNSLLQASMSGANIAGPGLAGVLVQLLGGPATLLFDAVSFLVSAAAVRVMGTREEIHAPSRHRRLRTDLRQGMAHMIHTPLARTLAIGASVCNLALSAFDTVVIIFLVHQLHLTPGLIGLVFGVISVGGLLGSAVAGWLARRLGDARTIVLAAVGSLFGLLTPLATGGLGLSWLLLGGLGLSAAIGVFNVCVVSGMQATVPHELLGRVMASVRVFSRGALPVGALLGGALATWLVPRAALAVSVLMLLPIPVIFWLSPLARVRTLAQLGPGRAEPVTPAPEPVPPAPEPAARGREPSPHGSVGTPDSAI